MTTSRSIPNFILSFACVFRLNISLSVKRKLATLFL
ncbi:unnamed protein product [Diatraea saccharalis]|uniref:Uncharacterized protein n=1 Tax=Diatraea saccharalis TaxID=40085 RepID=A0A9N9R932_9NEOP|nr:unnamed protein product [Diatraea saccharalis]